MNETEELRIKNLGGGSLLIAWQLENKYVLIVGGGEVASQRIESILGTKGSIIVVSPFEGLHPRTRQLIELREDRITYHNRKFRGIEELEIQGLEIGLVLTALDDYDLSCDIVKMCRRKNIPVNAADIPEACDFYFGAQIRDGPLQILISTNGNGPRMARIIKDRLQKGLTGLEGEALTKVGQLRRGLKERAPGHSSQVIRDRMKWMTRLCDQWELEDFSKLDDTTMEILLTKGWDQGKRIPVPEELGTSRSINKSATKPFQFDSILLPTVGLYNRGPDCYSYYYMQQKMTHVRTDPEITGCPPICTY